jgi:molybdopterin converting factor small subunit
MEWVLVFFHVATSVSSLPHKASPVKITFQFESQLRHAAGRSEFSVELEPECSVSHALQVLAAVMGEEFSARVLSAGGDVQSGLLIFLNERPVLPAELAAAILNEGDVLLLYPPISGG